MTAAELLSLIAIALLAQIGMGAGVAVWRHRRAGPQGAEQPRPGLQAGTGPAAAWAGWRSFRVVRRVFEDAALTQCSFHLAPVDGEPLPPFKPGQYLTFSLQVPAVGASPAGSAATRSITRCYSISDTPNSAGYRVTIKRVPPPSGRPDLPPGAASGHLHDHVHEGDVLQVKAPAGAFFIDPEAAVPAVLIAGGIGITPMMSMLRWCLAEQPQRPVHLYYGLRHSAEHAFKQTLEALAATHAPFHLHVVYSAAQSADTQGTDYQHAGHVDLALLQRTLPHGRHRFYVCGPPPMMASLVPALGAWGVLAEDIHHEAFGPASLAPAPSQAAVAGLPVTARLEIRFARSGRTLAWDNQAASLLDFAERHGIDIDCGCRSGSCGTCETRLIAGSVRYAHAPDHAIATGCCLPCVAVPQTALALEA